MSKKIKNLLVVFLMFLGACEQGFERFAPPANSISGRGAKQNPRIVTTTPANGATISPVTDANGTQIRIVFDMTMRTDTNPVLYTYVRDDAISGGWISVTNSGYTWTWSSTNFANDTLTISLGWVRWPENNVVAFDFDNNSLLNLDDMPLANDGKLSFTVGWNPNRYKIVPTGNEACYYYSPNQDKWIERAGCGEDSGEPKIGSQDYPAGQNGFIDPLNAIYGVYFYGLGGGPGNGRRFVTGAHPQNLVSSNCANIDGPNTDCQPYSIDSVTQLVWKTCSQGQYYYNASDKCMTSGNDYAWGEAVNACASLNSMNNGQGYGGRKDWRLPTIYELETLVDFGARITFAGAAPEPGTQAPAIHGYQQNNAPFNNEGPFPNTSIAKGYWTSTGLAIFTGGQNLRSGSYVAEFKKGHVGSDSSALLKTSRATTNRHKVRCVAGPLVAPPAPNFEKKVVASGANLTGSAATFVGYDNNATFNVTSVSPGYDVNLGEHSLTVTFNKQPNSAQAGVTSNYCIAAASATSCAVSSPGIVTALPISSNSYKLTLAAAMGANTAYKLFVSGIQSASDVWQSGVTYNAGAYVFHTGNNKAYRAINAHTSSANIATDVTNGDMELLDDYPGGTYPYPAGKRVYLPTSKRVAQVNSSYTPSGNEQQDIDFGLLTVVKTLITDPAQSLKLDRALFNGVTRATAPAPATVFNVTSASSPNTSTVQVTFSRLPDTAQASNAANYCIASATANPFDCSAPLASVSAVNLSGYTATLTTSLTAGTAYVVFVSGVTTLGSHVVDDNVNRLRWQMCRRGVFDSPTCADDGVTTNDADYWNDALNYCDRLNYDRYDGYSYPDSGAASLLQDRYRWRAPTINELKSISKRELFGTVGVSMDTTLFPTPNLLAEDYHSSTSYALSGPNSGSSTPLYNLAWGFNFYSGFTSIAQRDNSELTNPMVKPPKKNIRCVRSLP